MQVVLFNVTIKCDVTANDCIDRYHFVGHPFAQKKRIEEWITLASMYICCSSKQPLFTGYHGCHWDVPMQNMESVTWSFRLSDQANPRII